MPYFIIVVQAICIWNHAGFKTPSYQDPTTNNAHWLAIDFKPIKTFETPISLGQIKTEPTLQGIGLIKQPRLSIIRLSKNEFEKIINLA